MCALPRKRCPAVAVPDEHPPPENATVSLPSSATTQRIGRMKSQPAGAGPIHRPRPGDLGDGPRQNLTEPLHCGAPDDRLLGGHVFAARSASRNRGRTRPSPACSQSSPQHGSADPRHQRPPTSAAPSLHGDIVLAKTQRRASRHQPARRSEGFHGSPIQEIFGAEIFLKYYFKFSRSGRDHAGGNFFAANLKQNSATRGFMPTPDSMRWRYALDADRDTRRRCGRRFGECGR